LLQKKTIKFVAIKTCIFVVTNPNSTDRNAKIDSLNVMTRVRIIVSPFWVCEFSMAYYFVYIKKNMYICCPHYLKILDLQRLLTWFNIENSFLFCFFKYKFFYASVSINNVLINHHWKPSFSINDVLNI
jgi:hypothetical protein